MTPAAPEIARHARAWAQKVRSAGASTDSEADLEILARGWLGLLLDDTEGSADEALRQLSFHARNLGAAGQLASNTVMQAVFLRDVILDGATPDRLAIRKERADQVVRLAADAHATGASQRQAARARRARAEAAPIVRLPGIGVLGFVSATDDPELIDSLFGRLLRCCAGTGENCLVLDVGAAPMEDPLLHRTVVGFTRSEPARRYRLVVAGLEDPARTLEALEKLGFDHNAVELVGGLTDWLDPRLHKASQFEGPLKTLHTASQSQGRRMDPVERTPTGRHEKE